MAEYTPADPYGITSSQGGDRLQSELAALTAAQRSYNQELLLSATLGQQFGRTLTSAFIGLAVQGKSFSDVVSTLALKLSSLALGAAFKPLEAAFGNGFASLLGVPSPVSASGLSTPSALQTVAGTSLAGSAVGGASSGLAGSDFAVSSAAPAPSIVLNVTTPDVESFKRSETQLAAVLARAVGQGQRNL